MGICNPVETFPGDDFAQYYTTAIQILYYYDYLLTLPDEVLFTLYLLTAFSPSRRSSTHGEEEKHGVSLWFRPLHANCADRISLLALHARNVARLDSKSFLTHFAE